MAKSGRAISGIGGPWQQVTLAREALGLQDRPTDIASREDLFALEQSRLVVPPSLANGKVVCRKPTETDLPLIRQWRAAYHVEALGAKPSAAVDQRAAGEIRASYEARTSWVLTDREQVVAYTGFNATLPDMVQIG